MTHPNSERSNQPLAASSEGVRKSTPVEASSWAKTTVVVIGSLLVLSSIWQMCTFLNYAHYQYMFREYSEEIIQFRYLLSLGSRGLGMVIGIGILLRKENFRKAAIVLMVATIALMVFKHPFSAALQLNRQYINALDAIFKTAPFNADILMSFFHALEIPLAYLVIITVILVDDLCALLIIFFLTRPSVRAVFR